METPNNSIDDNQLYQEGKLEMITYKSELFEELKDNIPAKQEKRFIDQGKSDEQNETLVSLFENNLTNDISHMLEGLNYIEKWVTILYLGLGDAREPNSQKNIDQLFDIMIYDKLKKDPTILLRNTERYNKQQQERDMKIKKIKNLSRKAGSKKYDNYLEEITKRISPKEKLHYILSPKVYPLLFNEIKQLYEKDSFTFNGLNINLELPEEAKNILKSLSREEKDFIVSSFELYKNMEYVLSPQIYPLLLPRITQRQEDQFFTFDNLCNNKFSGELQNILRKLGEKNFQTIILFFDLWQSNEKEKRQAIATILGIQNMQGRISVHYAKGKWQKALRRMRNPERYRRHESIINYQEKEERQKKQPQRNTI